MPKRYARATADNLEQGCYDRFGGTEISENEQAALDEIAAIFDEVPPA